MISNTVRLLLTFRTYLSQENSQRTSLAFVNCVTSTTPLPVGWNVVDKIVYYNIIFATDLLSLLLLGGYSRQNLAQWDYRNFVLIIIYMYGFSALGSQLHRVWSNRVTGTLCY